MSKTSDPTGRHCQGTWTSVLWRCRMPERSLVLRKRGLSICCLTALHVRMQQPVSSWCCQPLNSFSNRSHRDRALEGMSDERVELRHHSVLYLSHAFVDAASEVERPITLIT